MHSISYCNNGCIFTNVTTVCAKVQNHETIEKLVTITQRKACVSNMSVVTVKQNDVSYYGTGKSNEIFQIGSMTKAFTGLVCCNQLEQDS